MSTVRKHFWHEVRRLCGGFSSPRKYGLNGCIPAVVSRTEGSYEGGTSEADAMRLWSRSSKNDRYCSRIWSAFTGRQSTNDCLPAQATAYFRDIELKSHAAFALLRTGFTFADATR